MGYFPASSPAAIPYTPPPETSGRIAGTYGADDLLPGGAKIRGLNLTPKEAQWAAGSTGDGWSVLWEFWDATWMEAQLDDAVEYGCNVVRTMGSLLGISRSNYSRSTYLGLWDDLEAMCETRGLYMYPCMNPGGTERSEMTQAFLETEAVAWAEHVHAYQRCIGIDVIQEEHAFGASGNGISLLQAIRSVTDLPLTYSIIGGTPSQLGHADNTAAVNSIVGRCDFVDLHWYYNPAETAVETYWWDAGYTKPLVIGEFGEDEAAGDAAQTAHYEAVADVMAYAGDSGRRPAGAFAWCARDFDTVASNQWGLKTEAGVARTEMTVPFQTIPKT